MAIVRGTLWKRDWFMDLKTVIATARQSTSADQLEDAERRAENDRRTYSDRRRTGGLFEVRARRDGGVFDRRQRERRARREDGRSWLSRWRREG